MSNPGTTNITSGNVFYLANFVLEYDPGLLVPIEDALPLIVSISDTGSTRTEQLELRKATEGRWVCAGAYHINPTSQTASVQVGRVGGFSLPIEHLISAAGGSISRPLNLSIGADTLQGIAFTMTCDVIKCEPHQDVGDAGRIDDTIAFLQTSVSITRADDSSLADRLADLSDALVTRFMLKENLEDIEAAVAHQRRAIELAPENASLIQLATWWDALGSCYYHRYDRAGDVADLEESIRAHQKSVDLTDAGDPALPMRLSNLGVPFTSRFERLGRLDDVDQAIRTQERAVKLTLASDPKLPIRLNNLGLSLAQRFHHTNDEGDLRMAIVHQQNSIALAPPNDPELSTRLHNLVVSLNFRLDLHATPGDLDIAISTEEQAIELLTDSSPNLPTWLNNLGALLNRRAGSTGSSEDLQRAISAHIKAVDLTPSNHPDLPIWWSNLGLAHQNKFIHTGDIDALQDAISVLQKSVKVTPPDHADLPGWLNNLSTALASRFEYTGDREDLEEAIDMARDALKILPPHRTSLRATSLHNLGIHLFAHSTRFLIHTELEESIIKLEEAVSLLPDGHAESHASMRALADAQLQMFENRKDCDSLHAAIARLENVVSTMAEENVMYSSNLSALGSALANRFELTGDEADWGRVIMLHAKAVELTPPEHPNMTARYNALGYSYLACHSRLKREEDLKAAVATFRKAAMWSPGTWMTRLLAAREWAKNASPLDPYESLDAYKVLVELVSIAASLRFTIQRRHQHLLETADISRAAAAVALNVGKVEQALEWLEQGRGLVWTQLNQLRTPVEALRAHNPKLAEQFIAVSKALENGGVLLDRVSSSLDEKMVLQKRASEQGKRVREWETLLNTIRTIPEFTNFLRPPQASSLVNLIPESGYAVVVNVHPDRCDAIALGCSLNGGRPLHIPLQGFSFEKAETLFTLLRTNLGRAGVPSRAGELDIEAVNGERDRVDGRREIEKLEIENAGVDSTARGSTEDALRDLWVLLAKPIIDALRLQPSPAPATRIWWCTTGVLSFLPIHAAGIYRGTGMITLADHAVSSYTPTVGILTTRARNIAQVEPGLLLVNQPNPPEMAYLPGTTVETELIQKRAEGTGVRLSCIGKDDKVDPELLMRSMQQHSCIHIACHASQKPHEPLASAFHLHGGDLRLYTIIQAHLTSADFAFLSACRTSAGDEDLSEEAVHLAAAMMTAGYRGVVSTMWSILDRYGAQVADDFYEDLFARSGNKGIDGSQAAYSLHHSLRKLRERVGLSEIGFLSWVPYVHFGL